LPGSSLPCGRPKLTCSAAITPSSQPEHFVQGELRIEFGLNNAHAIDSMLKHGGFSRHRLQGFL